MSQWGVAWWRRRASDVELDRGERLLTRLDLGDGAEALTTTRRLVVRRPGRADWTRRWWQLEAVSVEAEERLLIVSDVDAGHITLQLGDGDQTRFAAVLRERVQATLVDHRQVPVAGGSVRVALRKADGELVLQEQWQGRVDPDAPEVRAVVADLRRELASAVSRPDLAAPPV